MKRLTFSILILAALGGLIYLAARPTGAGDPPADERDDVRRVRVATVEPAAGGDTRRFSGVVRAERRARLAFVQGGRLLERPVEVGDRVARGQVLARLDQREARNAAAAARAERAELAARRAQAERERERVVRLVEARAATTEELERARTAADALAAGEEAIAARLAETERRLAESTLRAPFAGTVTEVLLEPGEHAAAGGAILALSGDGALEVAVEVPERTIAGIAVGDEARVELPAAGLETRGRVAAAARAAAGPGSLFPVIVALDAADGVAAGMTAEVILARRDAGALTVPVEAVLDPGGGRPAVFRVRGDGGDDGPATVEKVAVELGGLLGERVVVRGALAAGDRVVVGGQRRLLDGDAVTIVR